MQYSTESWPNKGRLCVERKNHGLAGRLPHKGAWQWVPVCVQQHCVWCGLHGVVSWCSNALLCRPSGRRHLSHPLELQQRLHAMVGTAGCSSEISVMCQQHGLLAVQRHRDKTSICVAAIYMLAAQATCSCSTGHAPRQHRLRPASRCTRTSARCTVCPPCSGSSQTCSRRSPSVRTWGGHTTSPRSGLGSSYT